MEGWSVSLPQKRESSISLILRKMGLLLAHRCLKMLLGKILLEFCESENGHNREGVPPRGEHNR